MLNRTKLALVLGVAALAACHGKNDDTTPKDLDATIPTVDPTLCDTNGKNVVTYDLNHDGKPDVWRIYKSEDEGGTKVEFMTCKQIDFDHDGRKDWVVAYNRKGMPLYEKADFDYDGKWDVSRVYDTKTGVIAEVERDTDFDGKFDVKELYDSSGQLTSIERDRNNDGKPDVWEQYSNGVLIAILYDYDFDTHVDRREEIPGAHQKIEMPTATESVSQGMNETPAAGSGSAAPKK